jgi:hypothetical protein
MNQIENLADYLLELPEIQHYLERSNYINIQGFQSSIVRLMDRIVADNVDIPFYIVVEYVQNNAQRIVLDIYQSLPIHFVNT